MSLVWWCLGAVVYNCEDSAWIWIFYSRSPGGGPVVFFHAHLPLLVSSPVVPHGSCVFLSHWLPLILSIPFFSFTVTFSIPDVIQTITRYRIKSSPFSAVSRTFRWSFDRHPPLCLHQTLFSPHCAWKTNCIIANGSSFGVNLLDSTGGKNNSRQLRKVANGRNRVSVAPATVTTTTCHPIFRQTIVHKAIYLHPAPRPDAFSYSLPKKSYLSIRFFEFKKILKKSFCNLRNRKKCPVWTYRKMWATFT